MNKHETSNQKGFTLVEVIISIAVLALICAIGLKLFVLSDEVTKRSKMTDLANIYTTNAIEICKAAEKPMDIAQSKFFQSANINQNTTDIIEITTYFDDQFNQINVLNEDSNKSQYMMKLTLSKNQADHPASGTLQSGVYDIHIVVENAFPNQATKAVVEYQTSKYYVYKE